MRRAACAPAEATGSTSETIFVKTSCDRHQKVDDEKRG